MSEKVPLAIKYRPKKLSDVIGQEVPVQILTNSFKDKNWHRAYLLCGNMGSGKTTIARIMAAMENSPDGPTLEPDLNSDICKGIFDGNSLDIKELDAASNRSINDVRAIKEEARQSPIQGRVKYYIIDEVHGFSSEAAEALLKFVEEPPPHVRIILCTTNPEALTDTLRSRCITLNFNRIGWHELFEHLKNVSIKEGLDFEEDALKFIAKFSKGSVRSSLQNLQSVLSFVGKGKITLELSQKCLGAVDESVYYNIIQGIVNVKIFDIVLQVNQLIVKIGNTESILKGLENYLRNLLLARTCGEQITQLGFSEDEAKRLVVQSKVIPTVIVTHMLKGIIEVQRAIEYNCDLQNTLELLLIEATVEFVKLQEKIKK